MFGWTRKKGGNLKAQEKVELAKFHLEEAKTKFKVREYLTSEISQLKFKITEKENTILNLDNQLKQHQMELNHLEN